MSFVVKTTPGFARDVKRLSKKFRSLANDLNGVVTQLRGQPQLGTPIGHNCYKIRVAIASKDTGKRGGARVITYVRVVNETIILLAIYDKSEQSTLTNQQVLALLEQLDS